MKPAKKSFPVVFVALVLFAAVILGGLFATKKMTEPLDEPSGQKKYFLKIERGDSAKKIALLLEKEKIIKSAKVFYLLARFPRAAAFLTREEPSVFFIKAGVSDLSSAMDAAAIYREISLGREELVSVSIPEGLTVSKIASRLDTAGICSSQDFIRAAAGLEGFLFPDTYSLAPKSDADRVVKMMLENFYEKISQIEPLAAIKGDKERLKKAVTLASIIEREYRSADEAPLIASVFTNRLDKNIGLYSCATVEYVITEVLGRPHPDIITYDDLKIQSPYNTYINSGLPPGPICNPGLVSLKAAAEPAKSDYYYFQLMDEKEGRHVFTKTLSEHVEQGAIFKTKKASR